MRDIIIVLVAIFGITVSLYKNNVKKDKLNQQNIENRQVLYGNWKRSEWFLNGNQQANGDEYFGCSFDADAQYIMYLGQQVLQRGAYRLDDKTLYLYDTLLGKKNNFSWNIESIILDTTFMTLSLSRKTSEGNENMKFKRPLPQKYKQMHLGNR